MATHTRNFSVEFTESHSASGWGTSTYGVKVNLIQTYQDNSGSSTISLNNVQFKREGNTATWSSLPIYGSVYVKANGVTTTLVSLDNATSGHRAHLSLSSGSYTTWTETSVTKSTASVTHDTSGAATITVGLTGGFTLNGSSYFGARVSVSGNENVFGVTSASKSSTLGNIGHTLTIKPNGGLLDGSPAQKAYTLKYGVTFPVNDATRTGYDFTGWTLSGGGTWNSETKKYVVGSSDGTLTAGWAVQTFTVSYDANGGSSAPANQTKNYGESLVLSSTSPARTGFEFAGWATSADAVVAQYQPGGTYAVNADVTLYAVWSVISFTLSSTVSPIGITVNVLRTSSPTGYGSLGLLSDGATLYYGDVIKVSWALSSGYLADTLTVNGVDVSAYSPAEDIVTITDNLTVVMTVKTGGVVYITNQPYQVFIWSGSAWEQYEAYIYNGATWDAY